MSLPSGYRFLLKKLLTVLCRIPWYNRFSFCCFCNSLLVFIFWQFNYDVSWYGSLCIKLFWTIGLSWFWMAVSFPKLRKFPTIIYSNMVIAPFTLFPSVVSHFSYVWLFATLWTVACQAPLSLGFSRQEYWSGLPCVSPGDLPDQGIEPVSFSLLHWQMGSLPLVSPVKWKSFHCVWLFVTPWTVACQSPMSMEFSRPGYWNG